MPQITNIILVGALIGLAALAARAENPALLRVTATCLSAIEGSSQAMRDAARLQMKNLAGPFDERALEKAIACLEEMTGEPWVYVPAINRLRSQAEAAALPADAAGSAYVAPPQPEFVDLPDGAEDLLRQALAEQLIDPDSARLSNLVSSAVGDPNDAGEQVVYVCGKVRAKNAYGGYTPRPARFYATIVARHGIAEFASVLALSGPDEADEMRVIELCLRNMPPD